MARRAAAWVAWTCNTGFCRLRSKRAGFGPLFCAPDQVIRVMPRNERKPLSSFAMIVAEHSAASLRLLGDQAQGLRRGVQLSRGAGISISPLARAQEAGQIVFLLGGEAGLEALVVEIDDIEQGRCRAVAEVRRKARVPRGPGADAR
jgi:hypothetical protein